MAKIKTKTALIALDMVHAALWARLNKMKLDGAATVQMDRVELNSIFLLVSNAMADLGDNRIKRKENK